MYYRPLPYPGCAASSAAGGCVSALGPPTVLYYFYPTILRDACPLCSLSDSARSARARSQGRRRRPGPWRHPMPPPVPPWPWTTTWVHLLWAADAAASLQTLHADLTQNKSPCRRAARLRLPSPLSRPTHPPPPPRGAALQAQALAPGGRQHRSEPRARRGGLRGHRHGGGAREGVLVVHAMQGARCGALSRSSVRSRRSAAPPPSSWRAG